MKKLVRRLIPDQWWSTLQQARETAQKSQARVLGKSPLGTRVYYAISPKFGREMRSVMAGRAASLPPAGLGYRFQLRRSVHRIEKGLINRPLRPQFALSYIRETTQMLDRYLAGVDDPNEDPLAIWATGVLTTYFSVCGSHPVVDEARATFDSLEVATEPTIAPSSPFVRPVEPPPVEYDQMLALARRRRSVRWYVDQPVPRDLVDQAIAVAAQSPSSCNRQPFSFRVFDDPALVKKIAAVPMGTAGFSDGFTGVIVVVGDLCGFALERDRHLIYIDSSLASMAFMLAAETLGFSTCPINWPDIPDRERELQRIMDLQPFERPVMFIAYGYADPEGFVPSSVKRPISELRTFNGIS